MGADKTNGLRPAEELGCLGEGVGGGGGWSWETLCLANLNIVIFVSQQNRAFDVTCQVPLGLGGWSSPLVRQPAASSSESTEPETPTCVVGL